MLKKSLIILVLISLILSCSNGLLEILERVSHEPEITEPYVESFTNKAVIEVSWDLDDGAEEYILFRSDDMPSPDYVEIYRGENLEYSDTTVEEDQCYFYILSKVRGTKVFGPSEAVFGVGSLVKKDELEDNNTKELATELVSDLSANLYFYQSVTGVNICDNDWYSVEIPPRRTADLLVNQNNLNTDDSTNMMFSVESFPEFNIVNNQTISIDNTSYESKTFYILISPKSADFLVDASLGGGKVINYTISFQGIRNL